jgi:hypothetical protein
MLAVLLPAGSQEPKKATGRVVRTLPAGAWLFHLQIATDGLSELVMRLDER